MLQLKSKIKTAATALPVTVEELRQQLRLGADTSQDTLLTRCIKSATNWAQNQTGRIFMPTTLVGYLPQLTGESIEIINGPISAISSIMIYEEETTETPTELDAEFYELDNVWLTAQLNFLDDFEAPDCANRFDAVQIEYTAGFSDADAVPEDIKDAIIMKAARLFTHPDDGVNERYTISESLLNPYKVPSV
jgi:uncharacterized phiE125 gp8 family phage protein